ncbi:MULTISPECIES: ComEC/Rec2 family competence protein [unclassified Caulobacter]|uniref:ComEC/Rec2 family competence protein n=1 Tax=unclassified Caulobacter TaxID=2648921 RepID=UPI001E4CDE11|nr:MULTISPECIES: ComEC/Rec2 family competence protein [unclassified Caulobacter]
MLWSPVAFGLGAAAYLEAPVEPPLMLLLAAALASVVLVALARRTALRGLVVVTTLLAFAAAGGLAGKVRSDRVASPVIDGERLPRRVEGFVVDVVSPGAGGQRVLIAPVAIAGLSPAETPKRLRVTVDGDLVPEPGEAVRFRAILGPPPPPAAPGAYDFARDAWFDAVGAVGFCLGEIGSTRLEPPPRRLQAEMTVNRFRWRLAGRILAAMGPTSGGIGAAMVTGHEAWITPEQTEAMRASGLAHILSISGLHMAIVGGFVFGLARLAIAASPWLALRAPGKKIAAVAGLSAVIGYLVISGAPPPAERAAITAAVAFAAILFDRQAITLHGLAVAALIILALQPEAAGAPGFQMSFAATTALIALAEAWPRPLREIAVPWPIRAIQAATQWLAVSVGASFVAGLATGPFAMQHFNRVAIWGLPANLIVAPLSSFVIMPFLALGTVLEAVGWGGPCLAIAGWGVDAMVAVAARFEAAGGQAVVASAPPVTLLLAWIGVMLLCLWRGHVRWLGLPLALAVALWPRPEPPDAWIAADGSAAAVRVGKQAVALRPEARRFGIELWARRRGLALEPGTEFDCNARSCRPGAATPVRLALSWTRRSPEGAELERLCLAAEVVVLRGATPRVLPESCRSRVLLTAEDFRQGGATELYRRHGTWWIVWAQPLRGHRPWTGRAS